MNLEQIGFKGIKVWEQPINIHFRTGEEYMIKFGDGRLKKLGDLLNFDQQTLDNMRNEAI